MGCFACLLKTSRHSGSGPLKAAWSTPDEKPLLEVRKSSSALVPDREGRFPQRTRNGTWLGTADRAQARRTSSPGRPERQCAELAFLRSNEKLRNPRRTLTE